MKTENRPTITMKGMPTAIVQRGEIVQIWVSSPTGDSSDSQVLEIICANSAQAHIIAQTWIEVWGLA
jgi:hypothetical protein